LFKISTSEIKDIYKRVRRKYRLLVTSGTGFLPLLLFTKTDYHTVTRKVPYHVSALDVDDDPMHPPVLNPEMPSGKIILY